jgi:hypothetical protein
VLVDVDGEFDVDFDFDVDVGIAVDVAAMYAPRCRAGYVEYAGRCWQFNTGPVTWHAAEARCMADNGHLATIRNDAEQDFIKSQLSIGELGSRVN